MTGRKAPRSAPKASGEGRPSPKGRKRTETRSRGFLAIGWDQSLNHSAVVCIDSAGDLVDFAYISAKVGDAKKSKAHGFALPSFVRNEKDRQEREALRLRYLDKWISKMMRRFESAWKDGPVYHGVEDYAYAAVGRTYQIGEVGGVLRNNILERRPNGRGGGTLRLHDPLAVKLFATNSAKASKEEMIEVVRARWGEDFSRFGGAEEDLSDAYIIARMVWTEVHLRAGVVELSGLEEGERRIFLRTTKSYPVNVLDRPWTYVSNEQDKDIEEALT